MNKAEYMLRLERAIIRLSKTARDEILYDYEEHFRLGLEAGKSEEEISRELGTPEEIAAPYVENLPPPPPQGQTYAAYQPNVPKTEPSSLQKLAVAILVILVNAMFIIPAAGGTLFGLWAAYGGVCIGFFAGGIALIVSTFFAPAFQVALIFFGLALLAITIPLCYGFYKVSAFLGKLIVKYVKFCIDLVNKGGSMA